MTRTGQEPPEPRLSRMSRMPRGRRPQGEVVRFLAYTGLRWGEMAALRVQDFDMLHGEESPPIEARRRWCRCRACAEPRSARQRWHFTHPLAPDAVARL
jgi:integrase